MLCFRLTILFFSFSVRFYVDVQVVSYTMPPKAPAKGKGSKGPSSEVYYEDQRLSDEICRLTLRLSALKNVFLDNMERTAEKQKERLLVQVALSKEEAKLADKKEEKVDILADFTREYKTDEREFISRIIEVDGRVNNLLEEKASLQRQIEETEKQYDIKIKEKKQQFESLCQRETEMEREFQVILCDVEESAKEI